MIRLTAVSLLALCGAVAAVSLPRTSAVRADATTSQQAPQQSILPGVPWADTSGNFIQAHNGSVINVGGTYYWIGQNQTGTTHPSSPQYLMGPRKSWNPRQVSSSSGPGQRQVEHLSAACR